MPHRNTPSAVIGSTDDWSAINTKLPTKMTPPAAIPIIESAARRPMRPAACSRGNPVDGSAAPNFACAPGSFLKAELFEVVGEVVVVYDDVEPSPPAPVGISGWSRATRSRIEERRPIGAANAGAAPTSARGANRRRERSQVLHASICRDTRLRSNTVKSPDHPLRMASSSSHSFRLGAQHNMRQGFAQFVRASGEQVRSFAAPTHRARGKVVSAQTLANAEFENELITSVKA